MKNVQKYLYNIIIGALIIFFSVGIGSSLTFQHFSGTKDRYEKLINKQNNIIKLNKLTIDDLENKIKVLKLKSDFRNLLIESIIKCESSGNPKAKRRIKGHGVDVGYFQINTYYHGTVAKKMGLNLYNPVDNIEYGMYLLNKEGSKPWRASKRCWAPLLRKKISRLEHNNKRRG